MTSVTYGVKLFLPQSRPPKLRSCEVFVITSDRGRARDLDANPHIDLPQTLTEVHRRDEVRVMQLPILLLGPMGAGKSTIATELEKLLGVRNVPVDRIRWYYYFKDGYSIFAEREFASFAERVHYWKPFEVSAVVQIIRDFPNAILDFGAGHSHFTDADQFATIERVLAPIENIFLILPSENIETSVEICSQRLKVRDPDQNDLDEINRTFVESPSNGQLAKHVIYNDGETPEATARRILTRLK